MMRHIASCACPRIELVQASVQVAQKSLQPRPVRNLGVLAKANGEHVGDRALLDHESAVHVGFAKLKLGIEKNSPFGAARDKAYRNRLAGPIAECEDRAARGGNSECPPPDEGLKEKLKQPVHWTRPSLHKFNVFKLGRRESKIVDAYQSTFPR